MAEHRAQNGSQTLAFDLDLDSTEIVITYFIKISHELRISLDASSILLLDKINKEVEKSTLGDLDALSALKDKMEDAGKEPAKKASKAKEDEK